MSANPADAVTPHELGVIGGHARAASLTPERRSEIARKAAAVRWGKPVPVEEEPLTEPIVFSLGNISTETIIELTRALDKAGFYLIRVVENGILKSGIIPKSWTR